VCPSLVCVCVRMCVCKYDRVLLVCQCMVCVCVYVH